MSVEALMRQAVTLRKLTGYTRTDGEAIPSYTDTETTMYLEPRTGSAGDETGRETPVGEWLGVGRREVDFDSWDLVLYGTLTLDITSPARPMFNPRLGMVSHVEMDLREINE